MAISAEKISRFLRSVHPYDALPDDIRDALAHKFSARRYTAGDAIYTHGTALPGLFLIYDGAIVVTDEYGAVVSQLGLRNSFGERGLLRDGLAGTSAHAQEDSTLLLLDSDEFHALIAAHDPVRRFFDHTRADRPKTQDLSTIRVEALMAANPVTCTAETTVQQAAKLMQSHHISSLCVGFGPALAGIVTTRDLSGKVLADGLPLTTPVADIMTHNPLTLPPSAIGSDVLHAMMEHRIGHIPIVEGGRLVGIVTQTDLTRFSALSSAEMVGDISRATTAEDMAKITARIPRLLSQLVASGNRHEVITRLITDIADTVTRRLLALAEQTLGAPPVPYLWLACGSQGRQEQTGVSDQDNCLFLDDAVTEGDMPYFTALANYVCDGLNTCGYVYCPGDMMATNPKWCQPMRVWRGYFDHWIATPSPEAQMLASVMFDLRPIGGAKALFDDLQANVLAAASRNSLFVAHMIGNSLTHTPPLGLLRGFATLRAGEHKNHIDLKHNGVVPIVDLGRVYALMGQLGAVNTRARLEAATKAGVLSASGGRDLLDAYDLIAETRLAHQSDQVKQGEAPDNFLSPSSLSEFERSHLRDAFVVVKSLQSALGHGRGV